MVSPDVMGFGSEYFVVYFPMYMYVRLIMLGYLFLCIYYILGVYAMKCKYFVQFNNRSLRWTCGSPRMLLVLIRKCESRRGEIVNLFYKKLKKVSCEYDRVNG